MEAVTGPFVEWGVAGLPAKGHRESGDGYLVRPVAGGVLLAVVDGLGHGREAAVAAEVAVREVHTGGRCCPEPASSGVHLPPLAASVVALTPGDLLILILATDGIRSDAGWQMALTGPPQKIADRILARYSRETDDALVLVARYLGGGACSR